MAGRGGRQWPAKISQTTPDCLFERVNFNGVTMALRATGLLPSRARKEAVFPWSELQFSTEQNGRCRRVG